MKKQTLFVLIAVAALTLVTACTKGQQQPAENTAPQQQPADTTAQPAQPTAEASPAAEAAH